MGRRGMGAALSQRARDRTSGGGLSGASTQGSRPSLGTAPPRTAPVALIRRLSPGLKVPHSARGHHPSAGLGLAQPWEPASPRGACSGGPCAA